MKKLRIGSIILFIISTAVFVGFGIYEQSKNDEVPPVISFDEERLVVSVKTDEEELLRDVKAADRKSGDVSNALVIEKISGFTEEGERIITYAAIDENGNVGRKERILRYKDYEKPQFNLDGPLRYPTGRKVDVLNRITAVSSLDGDLTDNIKYSLETAINIMSPGKYPIEFRVMDSGGAMTYLNTELEVYEVSQERIQVDLKKYIVFLNKKDKFEPKRYFKGSDEKGELEIQSNVDMKTSGAYYVDYIVKSGELMGKSRLIVVVNEE